MTAAASEIECEFREYERLRREFYEIVKSLGGWETELGTWLDGKLFSLARELAKGSDGNVRTIRG